MDVRYGLSALGDDIQSPGMGGGVGGGGTTLIPVRVVDIVT